MEVSPCRSMFSFGTRAVADDGGGVFAQAARQPFHVLVKPVGPLCNLDCEYCFYLEKTALFPGSNLHMSAEVLERHVRGYIESQPESCREVNFAWQGGEPTLAGLRFFEWVVELQERYRRPGMKITNALQTNGTQLDADWGRFLKANDFLVGISLDGPERFHDRYRKTKGGGGSFSAVCRGLEHLRAAGVEFNVLTVVQRDNGDHPRAVYEGLKDLGAEFIQFIPIVEREGEVGVSERSVLPEQFGRFLVEVFELWRAGDIDRIFVQHFNSALNAALGNPYTLCVHAPRCGRSVALEHNGDLFACDHFVFKEFRLGNIMRDGYTAMLDGPRQTAFGEDKERTLAAQCLGCGVRLLCQGGCPAHRFVPAADEPCSVNYLCDGYKLFFGHIEPYLEAMKAALRRQLSPSHYFRFLADRSLGPRRNDLCPCGSGRRFRRCCDRVGE